MDVVVRKASAIGGGRASSISPRRRAVACGSASILAEEDGTSNLSQDSTASSSSGFGSPKIPSYRMTRLPRGLALIVEIEEYDNDVLDRRHGSQASRNNNKDK